MQNWPRIPGYVFREYRQKIRDILRLCTIRHSRYATLVLLGIEEQSDINYAMPVRDYLYDALNYADQVESIRKKHNEKGDLKGAEFISGFSKNDRLIPVITLCICFDKKCWDGPRSLYEMFGEIEPQIKKYVNNYTLNLITPEDISDFTKFSSGLGLAMEFIHNSGDKTKIQDLIETRKEYRSVDIQTVDIINIYTSARISKRKTEGGKIDMCDAIKGIREDGVSEGMQKGEKMLTELLKLLKPDSEEFDRAIYGTSADRKRLYKKYNIVN